MKYGLIPEFIGRLQSAVSLDQLDKTGPDPDSDRTEERHHQAVPEVAELPTKWNWSSLRMLWKRPPIKP